MIQSDLKPVGLLAQRAEEYREGQVERGREEECGKVSCKEMQQSGGSGKEMHITHKTHTHSIHVLSIPEIFRCFYEFI